MLFGVSQGSIKEFSYMLFLFGYTFMDKQKAEDKNCAKFWYSGNITQAVFGSPVWSCGILVILLGDCFTVIFN